MGAKTQNFTFAECRLSLPWPASVRSGSSGRPHVARPSSNPSRCSNCSSAYNKSKAANLTEESAETMRSISLQPMSVAIGIIGRLPQGPTKRVNICDMVIILELHYDHKAEAKSTSHWAEMGKVVF